ncbi:MAG TPA: LacI family DNA-binding transcriptional regulator [Eubacteriales bacterium]|mgnify:FL=1|nr:LacI family DNA-binding transcriptional regulator [Eubacteriales bacterium]
MKNVTIYEIAEAAGVSASTVSRVINDKPGVKKATKKRVLECLEEHHFSPNETARGLVNQSSKMIGILISDMRTTHHTDGIYYIQREFSRLGYGCLIMNTGHNDEDRAQYIQQMNQRRVEAAVLIGSTFQSGLVKDAIEQYMPKIPIIIANGYIDLPNVYGVIADEQGGTEKCVDLLRRRGYRYPAFAANRETPSNLLKIQGFRDGVRRCFPGQEPVVLITGSEQQEIESALGQLFEEHPQTDSVVFSEDPMAALCIRALHDRGIDVPTQVGVIGINNSFVAEICNPSLTSLDNMLLDLSVTAARNLIDVLQGRHVVKKMMVYSRLIERESTQKEKPV